MPNVEAPVLANFEKALCQIVKQCEKEVNEKKFGPGGKPDRAWCNSTNGATGKKNYLDIGDEKSQCCERKVNERKAKSQTEFSKTVAAEKSVPVPGGGWCRPDVMVGTPPACDAVYDFKSSCPLTPASKPGWPVYGNAPGQRTPPNPHYDGKTQAEIYADSCGAKPKLIHPNSETCSQ